MTALDLREMAQAEKTVVIGSTLLLQLLDRLDALEKVAEAARPYLRASDLGSLEAHAQGGWPDDHEWMLDDITAGDARALVAAFARLDALDAVDEPAPAPVCGECGHEAGIHYHPDLGDTVPECAGTGPDGLGCRCVLTPDAVRAGAA